LLDEYGGFLRSSPRINDAAATIEPMFRRQDADRDGFLSLGEYRRSFPARPGGGPVRPDQSEPMQGEDVVESAAGLAKAREFRNFSLASHALLTAALHCITVIVQ
jgi:hypothetical protein